MSFPATFLRFNKRENSTVRPTAAQLAAGTTYDIVLKDSTSIISPDILLKADSPFTYNYCHIPLFDRYYFVNDWISDHGLWHAVLNEDVLASWRTTILSSSQYVLRAASRYNDNIVDALYPTNVNVTYDQSDWINPFGETPAGTVPGCFIISVLSGDNADKIGALDYYYMTATEFKGLMLALMGDDPAYFDIDEGELSYGVQKALVNPIQYITECYWLPYTPGLGGGAVSSIKIGWWEINISAHRLTAFLSTYRVNLSHTTWSIIKHPETNTRGKYLNIHPYTFYTLFSQVFGAIQLDSNMLAPVTALNIDVDGDFTGNVALRITSATAGDGVLIHESIHSVKVPLAIGQINNDPIGFINSIASTVNPIAGLLQGNVGSIAGTVSGITGAVESMQPKASGGGSNGSMAAALASMKIQCEFHYQVAEDITDRGRPLCERVQLSSLSGFVLCADANISTVGTSQEDSSIVNYLNSGVFIQ